MKMLTQLSITISILSIAGCAVYSAGPPPTDHLSGVTLPNQLTMYSAEQCVGAVVNGVCHGSVTGEPIGICHGTVLAGRCLGVAATDYAHPGRTNTQPRTHQQMMEQFRQPTYEQMIQNSNTFRP